MKKIEISVLIGLVMTILIGSITTFATDCSQIREDVLRLHILANSDTDEDQALKLKVRDRILNESGELFENPATLEEAKSSAADHIEEIRQIAQDEVYASGYPYQVNAEIVNMYFTTRQYETFTLPAGMYDAVQITIGEAKGHNWWCVLYPGLCRSACGGYDTPAENDLVCGEYIVRFRFVEWWGGLTAPREDVVLAG